MAANAAQATADAAAAAAGAQGPGGAGGGANAPNVPPGLGGGAPGGVIPPGPPGPPGGGAPPGGAAGLIPNRLYALSPALLDARYLDYTVVNDIKLFYKAIKPLPTKFDLEPGNMQEFLADFVTRAKNVN
jgi:hypothetical protein